jgi:valyl-tRNA synthetase
MAEPWGRRGAAATILRVMSAPESNVPPSTSSPTGGKALPNQYVPAEHEGVVRARWEASGAFAADPSRVLRGEAKPYCVVIPPPNVTDRLHLGHALNNTLQDVLIRSKRMQGYETLWMVGTDHAGIATQAVVERRLAKEQNKRRIDYSRTEFVGLVQAWKDEYEQVITNQLKMMGCSCDWGRQRFTMDEQCAGAVYEAFFKLFSDGLIYRGKRLVNWDPVLQTAVADDECYDEEIDGTFSYLRYPLVHAAKTDAAIATGGSGFVDPMPVTWGELARRGYPGASEHDSEQQAYVTVATTRPETYLGDTAVALNPHDTRAAALRGLYVELPLVGRIIPIVEDSYVVLPRAMAEALGREEDAKDPKAGMATGFLKVTPAHDFNDYEIGQRHNLAKINVLSPEGRISDKHGWTDVGDARHLVGLKRDEARKKVVKEFESRGLLEAVKPYRHSVPHSDRSKAIIEPYLSDQWYVKVTDPRLATAANEVLVEGQGTERKRGKGLTFHPPRYATTYRLWHENIRDWCISRQLWWGHQVPVWSGPVAQLKGIKDQLGSSGAAVQISGERVFVCLRTPGDAKLVQLLESAGFVRDEDVLDTWFSSALWPLSTMGWPEQTELLRAFNPTSTLCTAREIITLWVSRMVMFNRYLFGEGQGRGPSPFDDVVIHPIVQDGEGRKMSKSLGNGIDPLDIIASHGSDAMRFTLAQMTTQTQDVRLPVAKDHTGRNTSPKFDLGKRLCSKLWSATVGLALRKLPKKIDETAVKRPMVKASELGLVDKWMLSRLTEATRHVDHAITNFDYSAYATAVYDLIWRDFCDWYLEAIKPTIEHDAKQQAVLAASLQVIMRLSHPLMPYITEVLFEALQQVDAASIEGVSFTGPDRGHQLCTAAWPLLDERLLDEASVKRFEELREVVGVIRESRAAHNVSPKRKINLHAPAEVEKLLASEFAWLSQITIAGLSQVTSAAPATAHVAIRLLGHDAQLSDLAEAIDANAEADRKAKRIAELSKQKSVIEGRLNSPGYAQRAPAKLVEESKLQLKQIEEELAGLVSHG